MFVDRQGGVDLDALGEATRVVSAALDEIDPSPGGTRSRLQPRTRAGAGTPDHFVRAIGAVVTVRVHGGTADVRRVSGTLEGSGRERITPWSGPSLPDGSLRIAYGDVERARTVFGWGPRPKVRG